MIYNRTVVFNWTNSTDADEDTIYYDLFITRQSCTATRCSKSYIEVVGLTENNYTSEPLDVDAVYNWTVSARDASLNSGNASMNNFTLASLACLDVNNRIEFGTMMPEESKNTSSDNPAPFVVENCGNIPLNLSAYANA